MQVTNTTKGVVNYQGRIVAPGASFELDAEHTELPGVVAMLGSGALAPVMGKAEGGKPSDGMTKDQIAEALTAKGAAFDPAAKKADLAALLDAA